MRFPFSVIAGKDFDCVGFGLNAVDHLDRRAGVSRRLIPRFVLLQHKQAGGRTSGDHDGSVCNAWVFKTAYAGRFGSDAEGQFGFQAVKSESVDTEFAEVIEVHAIRLPLSSSMPATVSAQSSGQR